MATTAAVTVAGRDDEETARWLIACWLAEDAGRESAPEQAAEAGPTGWNVPPAPAREVVAVARRLAVQGLAGRAWSVPAAAHLLRARVLVVDEHPSANDWTERERVELGGWVAVLMQRSGEEGVQRLTAALAARR
ncbi:hypothetical protein ACWC9T_27790 [Kitasatospora sp. NPDC001159]